MRKFTRVELLLADGHLAGLFFTSAPLREVLRKRLPSDFEAEKGDWVPSRGVSFANWRIEETLSIGEIKEANVL